MSQWYGWHSHSATVMLVDGHGNFGSVDGDGAAAMRYTEARMSKSLQKCCVISIRTLLISKATMMIQKRTSCTTCSLPESLVNGTTGIAVGMATNIPPHNLSEVVAAIDLLMDNPDVTTNELMEVLPGPDFPTGGLVMGKSGIRRAYETGKGSITVRAKLRLLRCQMVKNGSS